MLHDERHAYEWRCLPDGSCLLTRRKLTLGGRPGKAKKEVLVPAHVMEGEHPEDVLRDVVDEGGFDY